MLSARSEMLSKKRALPLPREHGAWAILIVPYFTGAYVGIVSFDGTIIWPLAGFPAVLLLFLCRPAVMKLIKRRYLNGSFGPEAAALAWISAILAGGALVIFLLLSQVRSPLGLLLLGTFGAMLFCLHLWRTLARRERSIPGELIGVLMLTLTAPLACFLAAGRLDYECWTLWLLSALYFGASVFYVKMKLRASAGRRGPYSVSSKIDAGRTTLAYLLFMLIALGTAAVSGAVPYASLYAFAPVIIYMPLSVARLRPRANIKAEGVIQTLLAVAFGVLLAVAYTV